VRPLALRIRLATEVPLSGFGKDALAVRRSRLHLKAARDLSER
jgi:hypothetical protein